MANDIVFEQEIQDSQTQRTSTLSETYNYVLNTKKGLLLSQLQYILMKTGNFIIKKVREYRRAIIDEKSRETQGTQDEEKQNKNTTQHNM